MTIPDFQTLMLPVLKYASQKEEHSIRDAVDFLAKEFSITQEESRLFIPSGRQPIFYNRVGWARTYLKQAGLLETTKRNYLRITERGRIVLREGNQSINIKYLEKFPEFLYFKDRSRRLGHEGVSDDETEAEISLTPEESLYSAYGRLKEDLRREIIDTIQSNTPEFFEKLVIDLLVKMGYGGSGVNSGRVVGKVGDEGIDGVIDEDMLGLGKIYIQAKKWTDTPVGRPDIQKFVGALHGMKAKKGIFFTATKFSEQAKTYASNVDITVILIDGAKLADLMIEFGVGVSTISTYEVKKLDTDYFIETQ